MIKLTAVLVIFLISVFSVHGAVGPGNAETMNTSGNETSTNRNAVQDFEKNTERNKNSNNSGVNQPANTSYNEKFVCSEYNTSKDRIRCRINLAEENEYDFLPEECKNQTGVLRATCVQSYKKVSKCWDEDSDSKRFECAKKEYVLENVANERAKCEALENHTDCKKELIKKVDTLVKFRIYNLEQKAQKMKEKGANEETVVDFITLLESKKLEYNQQISKEGKKKILDDIRSAWTQFVKQARSDMR